MATMDMKTWRTGIAEVVSTETEEEILVRGRKLSELTGSISFAEMIYLMFAGDLPTKPQARVLDALLVASVEHGIAPPSMVARCFASYGTTIQSAVAGGIMAFGDRMGGLGEQLAKLMSTRLRAIAEDPAEIPEDRLRVEACAIVAEAHAKGERVPGYGIPLHGMDPRAPKVTGIAKEEGTFGPFGRLGELIEEELAARRGGRTVPMNLDGVGAVVVLDLGLDWRTTRMFLLTPRSVSMGAHYLEEQAQDTTWRHIPADWIDYES